VAAIISPWNFPLAICAGTGQEAALLCLDLDGFKAVNDTYGHATGDLVLIKKAQLIKEHVGDRGLVARYGGEEFSIVLPGADRVESAGIAEDIRKLIESAPFLSDEGESLSITVSIGVATDDGSLFKNVEQLVMAVAAASRGQSSDSSRFARSANRSPGLRSY